MCSYYVGVITVMTHNTELDIFLKAMEGNNQGISLYRIETRIHWNKCHFGVQDLVYKFLELVFNVILQKKFQDLTNNRLGLYYLYSQF